MVWSLISYIKWGWRIFSALYQCAIDQWLLSWVWVLLCRPGVPMESPPPDIKDRSLPPSPNDSDADVPAPTGACGSWIEQRACSNCWHHFWARPTPSVIFLAVCHHAQHGLETPAPNVGDNLACCSSGVSRHGEGVVGGNAQSPTALPVTCSLGSGVLPVAINGDLLSRQPSCFSTQLYRRPS
jgi:hypothetical protein